MTYKCASCGRESEEKENCCNAEMAEKVEENTEESAGVSAEAPKEEEIA